MTAKLAAAFAFAVLLSCVALAGCAGTRSNAADDKAAPAQAEAAQARPQATMRTPF